MRYTIQVEYLMSENNWEIQGWLHAFDSRDGLPLVSSDKSDAKLFDTIALAEIAQANIMQDENVIAYIISVKD